MPIEIWADRFVQVNSCVAQASANPLAVWSNKICVAAAACDSVSTLLLYLGFYRPFEIRVSDENNLQTRNLLEILTCSNNNVFVEPQTLPHQQCSHIPVLAIRQGLG